MTNKLLAEEVLTHPLRNALYETIRREPGVPFLELYHRFRNDERHSQGLGFGSLGYHLGKLELFGFITTRKSGRHRRHYENGGGWNGDTSALAVLQANSVAYVCQVIAKEPGLHQYALWQRISAVRPVTRQSLSYHMHRLERWGLVQVIPRGQARIYMPTPLLLRLLPFASQGAPTLVPTAS